jgi:hypothetical protein
VCSIVSVLGKWASACAANMTRVPNGEAAVGHWPGPTRSTFISTREVRSVSKKAVFLGVLAALGGFLAFRKVQAGRAEQDLWTEATDPVQPKSDLR